MLIMHVIKNSLNAYVSYGKHYRLKQKSDTRLKSSKVT